MRPSPTEARLEVQGVRLVPDPEAVRRLAGAGRDEVGQDERRAERLEKLRAWPLAVASISCRPPYFVWRITNEIYRDAPK